MGYQLVHDPSGGTWLILNAAIAVEMEDGEVADEDRDWLLTEYLRGLEDYRSVDWPQQGLARIRDFDEGEARLLEDLRPYEGSVRVAQHGSYAAQTRRGEHFIRYSAYRLDRRIAPDGGVLRGTYVTTVADIPMVPSGLAAVARYALPNPAPAIFEYRIAPPGGQPIHCGTCTPKHGEAGGGVEVRFDAPLPRGSAYGRAAIPER